MSCSVQSVTHAGNTNYTNFTFLSNDTGNDIQRNVLVVLAVTNFFVVLTNSILIYALFKISRPFTETTRMFVYLSCVDILTGITNVALRLVFGYVPNGSCALKLILYFLSSGLFLLGINIFFAISILRYLALKKPFLQVDMRIVWLVIFILFALSIANNVIRYLISPLDFFVEKFQRDQFGLTYFILFCIVLILAVNIASYQAIQTVNRSCINQTRNTYSGDTANDVRNNNSSRHLKKQAAETLIIITSFYFVTNIPMPLFTLLTHFEWVEVSDLTTWTFREILFQVILVNCGINAVVYVSRTRKIRTFLYRGFTCTSKTPVTNTLSEDHGL